jgi:hypothetical protein
MIGYRIVRYLRFAVVTMAILSTVSPAAALASEDGVLLSPPDYVYLAALGVQRDSLVLRKMSPLELQRLHYLINDEKNQRDPQAKINAVKDALKVFEGNQQWETENPGRLWDEKRAN